MRTDGTTLSRFLRYWILPPGCLIGLGLLAVWGLPRRPRPCRAVLFAIFLIWYLASTPLVSDALISSLENSPALTQEQVRNSGAEAIVVLGGGYRPRAADYGRDDINASSLVRTRYAAFLYHQTNLPVLLSGGGWDFPVDAGMQEALKELGVPPDKIWLEGESLTTAENARFSSKILASRKIHKILLVTQAWHMRRGCYCFAPTGMEVVPAPCDQVTSDYHKRMLYAVVPQGEYFRISCTACEEWSSNLFYWIFGAG